MDSVKGGQFALFGGNVHGEFVELVSTYTLHIETLHTKQLALNCIL